MKSKYKSIAALAAMMLAFPATQTRAAIDLEDLTLAAPPAQSYSGGGVYFNGNPLTTLNPGDSVNGSFTSGGAVFSNRFTRDADYGYLYWSGFSYSTTADRTTPDFANQYSSYSATDPDGSSADGDNTYAVGYIDTFNNAVPLIDLPGGQLPSSVRITNTTYTALYVLQTFQGPDNSDPFDPFEGHWLKLTIEGLSSSDTGTGSIDYYLADYRGVSPFLLDTWATIDLSSFSATSAKLKFTMDSNDVSPWGINAPLYFALDELALVPEPATASALCFAALCLMGRRIRNRTSSE